MEFKRLMMISRCKIFSTFYLFVSVGATYYMILLNIVSVFEQFCKYSLFSVLQRRLFFLIYRSINDNMHEER